MKFLNRSLSFLAVLLLPVALFAQTTAPTAAQTTDVTNLYAAGVSFNNGASGNVAGTALYARQVADKTYAFTVIDAVPNTLKPLVVNTNIGVGIAQKVFTVGKVPIFVPTSAGISWNGQNTGWKWDFGAIASFHVPVAKCTQCYIMPTVRVLKSSVSNGDGYQPIVGVLFGWGQ